MDNLLQDQGKQDEFFRILSQYHHQTNFSMNSSLRGVSRSAAGNVKINLDLKKFEDDLNRKVARWSGLKKLIDNDNIASLTIGDVSKSCLNTFVNFYRSNRSKKIDGLIIDSRSIDAKDVETLLKLMNNVKKLSLRTNYFVEDINLSDVEFSNLRDFSILYSSIHPKLISDILQSSINLEKLTFKSYNNPFLIDCKNANLESLKKLTFYYCGIDDNNINQILSKSINLQILDLDSCSAEMFFDLKNLENLTKLTDIRVRDSGFDTDFLNNIIKNVKNLKDLTIENFDQKYIPSLIRGLEKAKNISLNHFNFLDNESYNFFAKLKKAESISIKKCNDWEGLDLDGFCDNSNIKSFDLYQSSVKNKSLKTILQLPNIEKFSIAFCKFSNPHDFNELNSLHKMKDISIEVSNFDARSLGNILNNSPYIEKLDLSRCKGLSDLVFNDNTLFNNLRVLNLAGNGVTEYILEKFLTKAPNLEKIKLEECKNLNQDLQTYSVSQLREFYASKSPPRRLVPYSAEEVRNLTARDILDKYYP